MVRGGVVVDRQREDQLCCLAPGEAQVDGGGLPPISGVVGGGSYFVVEVEVIFREPVGDGVASRGGVCQWGQWALPPCVVRIEVPHKEAVCW